MLQMSSMRASQHSTPFAWDLESWIRCSPWFLCTGEQGFSSHRGSWSSQGILQTLLSGVMKSGTNWPILSITKMTITGPSLIPGLRCHEVNVQGEKKLMCWAALLNRKLLVWTWLDNDSGSPVRVNQTAYQKVLVEEVHPTIMATTNIEDIWWQQDGATCHMAKTNMALLRDTLGPCIISHNGPINWPAHSPNLLPFDFFFWGAIEQKGKELPKPATLEEMKEQVEAAAASIIEDTIWTACHSIQKIWNWSLRKREDLWSITCESFSALLLLLLNFLFKIIPDDYLQCLAKTANHDEFKNIFAMSHDY